jgi:flagellin-like protein
MNNKKGISAIVATVLIILITVAAVTIIWAAIIPMISNQLDKGTLCLDAVSQVIIENQGYTCFDVAGNYVDIQVSHGAKDFVLSGIQVLVFEAGSSNSTIVTTGLPGVNEESVIRVSHTEAPGELPNKIEIAPIVAVGNAEETCGVSSTLAITTC